LRGDRVIRTALKKAAATRVAFEGLEPDILDRVQGLKFFTGATGSRRLSNMPLGT